MLVKAWFPNNIAVWTNKHERYNNEEKHTFGSSVSTKKKWVKVHDIHYVDFSWCFATLHVDVKSAHSLDCDMQENVSNVDHLHCASVLVL